MTSPTPHLKHHLLAGALFIALTAGAGYAMAQAQGAVGAALGAPAAAKVAAPPAAPTVKAGQGGLVVAPPIAAPADGEITPEAAALRRAMAMDTSAYMPNPDAAKAAEFDRSKQVQVRGVIRTVMWVNPSAAFIVADSEGRLWRVMNDTPNSMLRMGLNRTMLTPGAEIVVDGHPSRDGVCDPCRAEGVSITFADGTRVPLTPSAVAATPAP